jgi:UDP-glucose 4-epimerase
VDKIMIIGAAGSQGRLVSRALSTTHDVCGVDIQGFDLLPPGMTFHRVDLRGRRFEDVMRREQPSAVVHLGFLRSFREGVQARHDVNVLGTKKLLDHCAMYGVKKLIVVSSGYVYGAHPEHPYFMDEDAPLSASRSYPEIRDLVELDTLATGFIWRHPDIQTAVLRHVNVVGPTAHSMAREILRMRRVPTVLGFDPMFQFIDEQDLTRAIVLTLARGLRGVFNVEGAGEVPLHTAIREAGGIAWPFPQSVLRRLFDRGFRSGLWPYPSGVIDYLMYPVSLSGRRFRDASGFRCQVGLPEMFDRVRGY